MRPAPPPARHRSLRNYWLLLALALAVLGLQMVYDLHQSRQRLETEAQERLVIHSVVLTEEMERRLRSINQMLLHLRGRLPAWMAQQGGTAELSRQLDSLVQTMEGVRTLLVLDARGNAIATNRQAILGQNFSHRPYFKEFRDRPQPDRLHLSPPFVTTLGIYTLNLVRPVYDAKGEFLGVVSATLDAEGLGELMLSLHASVDTRLSIVHGHGEVLKLVPERKEVPSGTKVDKPGSFYRRHMESGQTASLMSGTSGATGTMSTMSMRTLQPANLQLDAPLVIAVARDTDSILEPWQAQVRKRIAVYLLIVAITVFALAFYQTRQHRFEERLRQTEDERQRSILTLQRFIDHLPGSAYVKDAQSRTLMASRGFQTLLGMDPAAMIGKTSAELFPGEFGAKILEDDRKVLESGQTTVIEESFGERMFESTKFVIDAAGERQLGGITIDITARKQAEREKEARIQRLRDLNDKLEAAQSQLLQSEKMASIGQLAAGVAHELNNPIGFVHSNLGTLEKYLQDIFEIAAACEQAACQASNPQDFATIEAMKRNKDFAFIRQDVFSLMAESKEGLERVRKIVLDLKDFSRPGESAWQWADLHAGLDSTLNIVWNELKYKCTVHKAYGTLPQVYCVISQLNQVFMNLLLNAAHAIPERGEITVRTGLVSKDTGEEVFVAVSDDGVGIPPDNLNRLFEPFFTTKPVGKGTGLGLSLAYSIVQKHHGRIEVASTVGQGSTFTVWLPVNQADPS